MRTIVSVALVALLSFLGTMFDDFFAFAAQLVVTAPSRVRRVSIAQALGVTALVIIAAGLSSSLGAVPLRWFGLLSIAPFSFAWYAWRQRHVAREEFRRGAITTFLVTIALGGDNVAVWTALLRVNGVAKSTITVATFALCEIAFLVLVRRASAHPHVVRWGERHAPTAMPVLYVALGVLVLIECRTLSF